MLKLKEITKTENIKNESDYYIKIKIIFEKYCEDKPIYYWSTSGPEKTLIKIKLKESTGAVHEITVISMPKKQTKHQIKISPNLIEKIGLPVFEIPTHVDPYSLRETKDFEFYTDQQNVYLLFSSNEITLNIINGPIIFRFDSNNFLCSIKIKEMTLNKEGVLEELQKSAEKNDHSLTFKKEFTNTIQKDKSCILTFNKALLSMISNEIKRLNKHKIDIEKPIFHTMEKLSSDAYGLTGYDKVQININDFLRTAEEFFNFATILKEAIDSAKKIYTWDNEYYRNALDQYNILLNYFSE